MIELNEKQKQGLQIAVDRYKNQEKYTVISGYARYRKEYSRQVYYRCSS